MVRLSVALYAAILLAATQACMRGADDSEQSLGGVGYVATTIDRPGVIRQTGTFMRLVFGELDGRPGQRGAAFQSLCQSAGFEGVNSTRRFAASMAR